MHKNLRLFYFLLLVTAIAAGVRYMDTQEAAEISKAANAADFAIADTAAVDKIFIADKDGNQALLERSSGRYWKLNGTHFARKDAVDLLLKTFLRARVQRPVPQGELSTVNRLLAGRGKKVEIYQGGETPVKTWYIGTSSKTTQERTWCLPMPTVNLRKSPSSCTWKDLPDSCPRDFSPTNANGVTRACLITRAPAASCRS